MAADDIKNVHISVLKHFEDELSDTAAIDVPGAPFNNEPLSEWYQPRVIGPTGFSMRRGERRETYLLNVNCFARTGRNSDGAQRSTIWRHHELAGEVSESFRQVDVAVQDWDGVGDPTVGYLRFEEPTVVEVHDVRETDLQQATVSVTGWLIL